MLEYFVLEITIVAQPPFAVSSREPSQGLCEVESFPGLADPGAAPVRDVPCGDVEDSTHIQHGSVMDVQTHVAIKILDVFMSQETDLRYPML